MPPRCKAFFFASLQMQLMISILHLLIQRTCIIIPLFSLRLLQDIDYIVVKAYKSWWAQEHMPVIPALERQRQTDLCKFQASLVVYRVSSWKPCLNKPKPKQTKKHNKNETKQQQKERKYLHSVLVCENYLYSCFWPLKNVYSYCMV